MLDGAAPVVVGETHPSGEFRLHVERQAFLRAADDIMELTAHVPQERLRLLEGLVFVAAEHVVVDKIGGVVDVVKIFSDPIERLQVAQAALALLDVGLDEIAAFALALVALAALGQFGRDEILARAGRHFRPEAFAQFVVKIHVAPKVAGFEKGGADRDVLLGEPDAFAERARRMTDLQPQIPQHVQDEFDDALAPGGLLEGPHEQQIDVRAGRQLCHGRSRRSPRR